MFSPSAARSSTRPWRFLLLGLDEAESEDLLLGRSDASYSAMTKPSRRVFHSFAARSSTHLRQRLLLIRGDVFYSSARRLLLVRCELFYSAMTKPSQRVFYSSAANYSTPLRRRLLLVHGEVFYSSVAKSFTHLWRRFLLVRGDVFHSSTATSSSRPR